MYDYSKFYATILENDLKGGKKERKKERKKKRKKKEYLFSCFCFSWSKGQSDPPAYSMYGGLL